MKSCVRVAGTYSDSVCVWQERTATVSVCACVCVAGTYSDVVCVWQERTATGRRVNPTTWAVTRTACSSSTRNSTSSGETWTATSDTPSSARPTTPPLRLLPPRLRLPWSGRCGSAVGLSSTRIYFLMQDVDKEAAASMSPLVG